MTSILAEEARVHERHLRPTDSKAYGSKRKLSIVLGTRPEIIKMAPIIRCLERMKAEYFILHTGQHYSYNMDRILFEQLNLPRPKINLDVRSGTHAEQTARMLVGIEKALLEERPNMILVEGDTNTVLAAVIAASKLSIKIGHVEAGLRSQDRRMPEEINRVVADHVSDYLYAPTEQAKQNLRSEGIPETRILVTGNTIVDALLQSLTLGGKDTNKGILESLGLHTGGYALATLHRQENVDRIEPLTQIIEALELVSSHLGLQVLFFVHPRTRERLARFNIDMNHGIRLLDPQDYLNFIALEAGAGLILTDSGGVQEEACILKVPCVTMRENTERPETIQVGANMVAGRRPESILVASMKMIEKDRKWSNPFGDGRAAERIVNSILMEHEQHNKEDAISETERSWQGG